MLEIIGGNSHNYDGLEVEDLYYYEYNCLGKMRTIRKITKYEFVSKKITKYEFVSKKISYFHFQCRGYSILLLDRLILLTKHVAYCWICRVYLDI
jgi:hypothetical protein